MRGARPRRRDMGDPYALRACSDLDRPAFSTIGKQLLCAFVCMYRAFVCFFVSCFCMYVSCFCRLLCIVLLYATVFMCRAKKRVTPPPPGPVPIRPMRRGDSGIPFWYTRVTRAAGHPSHRLRAARPGGAGPAGPARATSAHDPHSEPHPRRGAAAVQGAGPGRAGAGARPLPSPVSPHQAKWHQL